VTDTLVSSRFYAVPESPELAALLDEADALRQRIDALRPLGGNLWETVQLKLKSDWTYDSNAIEGSTLTRGETNFFLQEGLTVKGKPLKDFLDARNHAEAIDFLRDAVRLDRPVSEGLIKEINALLLNGVSHTPAIGQGGAPVRKPAHPGRYKLEPNHVLTRDGSVHRFTEPLRRPARCRLCAAGSSAASPSCTRP
jgi:Fic family protein